MMNTQPLQSSSNLTFACNLKFIKIHLQIKQMGICMTCLFLLKNKDKTSITHHTNFYVNI